MMITMQQRTITITDPREAKEMELQITWRRRRPPEASEQTEWNLNHKEHDGPKTVVTKETLANRPGHLRHREAEGDLIRQTSSVESDNVSNIQKTRSNNAKVLESQYAIHTHIVHQLQVGIGSLFHLDRHCLGRLD